MLQGTLMSKCRACFLGTIPRYLTNQKEFTKQQERDQRREAAKATEVKTACGSERGPRPERESLRKDTRPARGRGRGGPPGRGGFDGGRGGYDNSGAGNRGGFSSGRGAGRGGFNPQNKPMWPCACGKRNFESRTTCFACSQPKAEGVVATVA